MLNLREKIGFSSDCFGVINIILGAIVVYDITDVDSFDRVNTWIKELRKYLPKETPLIIAGNKCDMVNR